MALPVGLFTAVAAVAAVGEPEVVVDQATACATSPPAIKPAKTRAKSIPAETPAPVA